MEIIKGKLIEVNESDLVKGVFYNDKITEVGDHCLNNMPSLKKIVLPNATTFGSYCLNYNQALTEVSLPNATTFGSDCLSSNQALTEVSLPKLKIESKVKAVDGFCFVIENENSYKGIKIYSGFNFLSAENKKVDKEDCYVASKGKFMAHGETVKKAISDLQFKIIAEKLKNKPILKDTVININHYRLITGACELGVKSWMKQHNVKEGIKAKDLLPLLEKTHAYGMEKFKSLMK